MNPFIASRRFVAPISIATLVAGAALVVCALDGCALAELGGVAELGAGEAAAIGAGELAAAEGGVEALGAGEAASLSRAAALRGASSAGVSTPLVEEVGVVRSAAQMLTYPEEYGLGRWRPLRVEGESGARIGELRRTDANTALARGRYDNILGESVRRGNRIDHYTGPNRTTLRGYTIVSDSDGMLRHWVLDPNGKATFVGAERIVPLQYTTPESISLPLSAITLANVQLRANDQRDSEESRQERAPSAAPSFSPYVPQATYHPTVTYHPQPTYRSLQSGTSSFHPYVPPSPRFIIPARRTMHVPGRPPPLHYRCGALHYPDQICPATGLPFS